MKIYFKKGIREDKLKRWYVTVTYADINNSPYWHIGYSDRILSFNSWHYSNRFSTIIMQKYGLKLIKDQKWRNDPIQFFVYFRSHADEAEFMLKYSGGLEVEI